MAYTEDDLTAIKNAINLILLGKQVKSVKVNGKTIEYQNGATLVELRAHKKTIETSLGTTTRRSRIITFKTGKSV